MNEPRSGASGRETRRECPRARLRPKDGDRSKSRWLLLAAVALVPLSASSCGRGSGPAPLSELEELLEVYDYDPDAPLPFAFEPAVEAGGGRAIRFRFRTWERESVPGLLVLPAGGSGPHPLVVYFHRSGEDESAALEWAAALEEIGAACLSIRQPASRAAGGSAARAEKRRESFRNRRLAVLEARSALDAVAAESFIDPNRVAAVGAGTGGGPSVVFAAVEPRVRAVVAISSGASDLNRTIPERAVDQYAEEARRTIAAIDPLVFAPRIPPRPILAVRGALDPEVSEASARAFLEAAGEPRRLATVEGAAHVIPLADAAAVVSEFLLPVFARPR